MNTLKQARNLTQLTLSDLTISDLDVVKATIKSVQLLLEGDHLDSDIKEALNILETSLSATGSNLNDLDSWEIDEIINEILNRSYDFEIKLPSGEVRIIDKDVIEDVWHDSLIEQIKDCYDLSTMPDFIEIDWDKTVDNCKVDGLGHHFSGYDGEEHETATTYIFRTN